jgi:inosine/xanthosine triphosphate pyrophosphatase family protein
MESVENDRSAYFVSCLVYVDSSGDHRLFQDDASSHEISRTISSTPLSDGWSDLWRVLIPEGENVPYPDLEEDRRAAWKKRRAEHSVFQKFSRWLHSDSHQYSK